MTSIVYTARMGQTDALLAPLVIDPAARYLCFSDQPCAVAPYEWVQIEPTADPRMAARRFKVLADHPLLTAADVTLWHDASYRLQADLGWATKRLAVADIVAMRHPRRFNIEQEAIAIARYGYLPVATAEQYVAGYRAEGFLENILTCSGLLARGPSESVRAFNAAWWAEVLRWNGRDQASTDYAAGAQR